MPKAPAPQPSDLELQVLSLLWAKGPQTVRQIQQALPDGKPRAYTTVLTILQVMEKKGLVEHDSEGPRHIFKARARRRETLRPLLRGLLRNIFGGSPAAAMQSLLSETSVTEEDLNEMRRLLDEAAAKTEPAPEAPPKKGGRK